MFLFVSVEISTSAASQQTKAGGVPTQGVRQEAVDARRANGHSEEKSRSPRFRSGSQETPLTDVCEQRVPRVDPPKAPVNSFSRGHAPRSLRFALVGRISWGTPTRLDPLLGGQSLFSLLLLQQRQSA